MHIREAKCTCGEATFLTREEYKTKGKYFKISKKRYRIIISLLTLVIIASIMYIVQNYRDKAEVKQESQLLNILKIEENKVTEVRTERMLQVEKLRQENSDIVGWLEIEGTNVNYPVLQAEDNSYYMNHNYKKEENTYGSIFLDKDYDWSKPSSNLLIYGHNLQNGSMFHDLLNYSEKKYYEEHPNIRFTTETEDMEFEIISAFYSRVYYKSEKNVFRYYYFVDAENKDEYNKFVKDAQKASIYDTEKTTKYGDRLITLSTCSYHTEDGRFAVVAREKDKD